MEHQVADLVLRDLHTVSDAIKRILAKLAARRSGSYLLMQKISYTEYLLRNSQMDGQPTLLMRISWWPAMGTEL